METVIVYRFLLATIPTVMLGCVISFVGDVRAEDDAQTYVLRYKLNQGEQIHYEVTHVAKTMTRINGAEDLSNVHTVSNRHWDVKTAAAETMTFDHIIDGVVMTQQQGEADEIRWNSENKDEDVPPVFERVAERIGKTLSTVTVNPQGQEQDRENNGGTKASLGMGSLTLALPEQPIKVGDTWTVPREIKTRTEDGLVKPIKIRELYELEKVKTGVATISIRSEPLTPIDDASIRAQVVQQLSNGEIRFDIDNGRMLTKELNWDETVVGFQGATSLMEYRARMSEKLVDGIPRTAQLQK